MHQEGGILGRIGRVAFLPPPSPLRDISLHQASCVGTLKTLIPYGAGRVETGRSRATVWESGSLGSCLGGTTCPHRMLGLRVSLACHLQTWHQCPLPSSQHSQGLSQAGWGQ